MVNCETKNILFWSFKSFCFWVVVVVVGGHGFLPTIVGYAMRGGGGAGKKHTK